MKKGTLLKDMSIEQLYKQHRIASQRAHDFALLLESDDSEVIITAFASWDIKERLCAQEIDRRAELLPMPVVMDLINSGLTFSTRQ